MPLTLKDKSKKNKLVSDILKSVKLKDAGYKPPKPKKADLCCGPIGGEGISYPSLYINSKNAPELIGSEVEEEVLLLIKGKITSHSLDERKGNSRETWDIQIKEIGNLSKNPSDYKKK